MKLKIYEGTKKRLASGAVALMVLVGGSSIAKADTKKANEVLDSQNLIYNVDDSLATNLVINSKDVLVEVTTNGSIPAEYQTIVVSPELTLNSENKMREVILNKNFESLFTNPEEFNYLSMGSLYMDNETEKVLFYQLSEMINHVSLNPTEEGIQGILDFIRIYSPLFSVGGRQALATDLFYLQALAQVYNIDMDQLTKMASSFGENADAITFINAIISNQKCR